MASSFAANHSDDMKVLSIYGSKDLVMNKDNYKKEKDNAKLFTAKKQWELTADKILEWIKE